jgi:hypothetical protein
MTELPGHVNDAKWHDANTDRYNEVLRDPTRRLVEMLRSEYMERLSPEVAGGKRPLSILKKNDYGKGGYYDHYWCAFYDPKATSKTKSVQLFFHLRGRAEKWGYGFSMGNYCEEYMERLRSAWQRAPDAVASYIETAPAESMIFITHEGKEKPLEPMRFAAMLRTLAKSPDALGDVTKIQVIREYPLKTLPEHDELLVEEVGQFFTWAWPLFEASRTGTWGELPSSKQEDEIEEVDETASGSLEDLSKQTSLPMLFLEELEQALLAKQQVVLVGPPGTSKTYIARQFARYFVAQRPGRPQGSHHILYMHANWGYEDFFEGIKPQTGKEGALTFDRQKGFFLEWTEQLKGHDSAARHVLVLDEINRCDTAAVLGELLQLLEYRGTTVRLLSGRQFVFPRNLFVIGTMNSADRSIGRMDLALRRRFLWLDLHPLPDALQNWLDRPGNNPIGFNSSSLQECNELLTKVGIPSQQHIGHALFMLQGSSADDSVLPEDVPLTEKHLQRIVKFSVLPYVRELLTTQLGQANDEVVTKIGNILLAGVTTPIPGQDKVQG